MSRELSVLIIQPWLNYRGAESVSIDLCKELDARGIHARILCLYVSDAVSTHFSADMLHVPGRFWQLFFKNKICFFIFGFWGLLFLGLFYGRKYQVYNPHNFPSVWVAVLCSFVYQRRVVWTVHNFPQHPFHGAYASLFEYLISGIDSYLVSCTDAVVAVSRKVATIVYSKYSIPAKVIYPGIPVSFWQKKSKDDCPFEFSDKRILLHAGQIRPEKRQDYSVRFFNLLVDHCPDLVLVFAGERTNGAYPELASLSEQNKKRIFFTGRIPKEKLRVLYSLSEFLILPSHLEEGCNLVPLEAMASGVAHIFVARGSGVDELLDTYGRKTVFDSENNINDTVSLFRNLYLNGGREDYGVLVENSSLSRFIEEYLAIFER